MQSFSTGKVGVNILFLSALYYGVALQADVDNSGALDFLESLFCFVEAAKRLPWIFPPALRYTTTKLFRGAFNKYKGSPTDDTIDVDELEDLFQGVHLEGSQAVPSGWQSG